MKYASAGFIVLSLVSVSVFGQTTNQEAKRSATRQAQTFAEELRHVGA